jgi:hypothetical protein
MYKDKVDVYTFIQVDDWSYTVVDVYINGLYLPLYTDRRLVIYIYVYIFIQTDDWSYTVVDV